MFTARNVSTPYMKQKHFVFRRITETKFTASACNKKNNSGLDGVLLRLAELRTGWSFIVVRGE